MSIFALFERNAEVAVVPVALLLAAAVGLIDYATGPELSVSPFYLVPVAVAAWWGGFAHAILVSLAATIAWHLNDTCDNPDTHVAVQTWNAVVRFGFFVIASSVLGRLQKSMRQERALARTDPLTGVANARTFYQMAQLELQRFSRTRRPFTVVYFDLDNFKSVNDRLGHSAGDELLRQVAHTIQANTRASDLIARLGGDEFALLFPETDCAAALAMLERLRGALARETVRHCGLITFSMGAATFLTAPLDVDVMIQRVDSLMYGVKRSGKGRIEHAVIRGPEESTAPVAARVERRATVRMLCNQPARVSIDGSAEGLDGFAIIWDVSVTGIGLALRCRVREGTLLTVEPLRSGSKTLLARVIRTSRQPSGWLHGCALATSLSKDELHDWIA
jgi:diguanylate cyclase (GGDEF)-like protein